MQTTIESKQLLKNRGSFIYTNLKNYEDMNCGMNNYFAKRRSQQARKLQYSNQNLK